MQRNVSEEGLVTLTSYDGELPRGVWIETVRRSLYLRIHCLFMTTGVVMRWHKFIGCMLRHVTKYTSGKGGEWKGRRNDMYAACRSSRTSQVSRQITAWLGLH